MPSSSSSPSPRPWVAVLFSLLLPGLGHLYTGKPARAAAIWAGFVVTGAMSLLIALALPLAPTNILLAFVVLFGAFIIIAWDAHRTASKARNSGFVRSRYNRWYVYVGLILIFSWVLQPMLMDVMKTRWVEAYRLPNDSMAPTLRAGDYLFVRKQIPTDVRGRIVVFRAPLPENPSYIKRVLAVGGDTIAMSGKRAALNGKVLAENYVQHVDQENDVYAPSMYWQKSALVPGADSAEYQPTRDNWGPLIVPAKHVFVLGDNRDDSEDSRYFGFIHEDALIGLPKRLYFTANSTARWDRIGRDVSTW